MVMRFLRASLSVATAIAIGSIAALAPVAALAKQRENP
jgi:hypothetical protein